MGSLSLTHILLIAVVFIIFFGPSKLPQLGQSIGKAIRGFKQGLNEIDVDAKDVHDRQQVDQAQEKTNSSEQKRS